ncbi:MAG TPA: IS110 family transposase [Gemmatimonadales bacterium]|jgi:transposase
MKSTTIAVDLAKSVFQVAVSRQAGKVAEVRRLTRSAFRQFLAQHEPATVLLEACGTAHYWARELETLGHQVVLLPPHAVRPYVPRNKTDQADAKALLEAYRNEAIHPVPAKSVGQQCLTALHRVRTAWMRTRIARINFVRASLRELGWSIPVGAARVLPQASAVLEDPDSELPSPLRHVLKLACEEIRELEKRIHAVDKQLRLMAAEMPLYKRLLSIPGVGPLSASALIAFLGEMTRFQNGRRFACFLGLTPRERSSGLKRRLGAISKQGDTYLRTLLIHGARSVLLAAKRRREPDRLRAWALQVQQRRGHNTAAVALANKLARIVWAVWTHDEAVFQSFPLAVERA